MRHHNPFLALSYNHAPPPLPSPGLAGPAGEVIRQMARRGYRHAAGTFAAAGLPDPLYTSAAWRVLDASKGDVFLDGHRPYRAPRQLLRVPEL